MNDRFKFRAWDKDYQEWATLLYWDNDDGWNGHIKRQGVGIGICSDSLIVMQSTGLKDKNGKLIFGGDIITGFRGTIKFIVEYSLEDGGYVGMGINNNSGACLGTDYLKNFKIIGNIHENPELLEEK